MALGENGILNNAKFAQEKYENEKEKESIALANYESEITGNRDTVTISKEEYEELKKAITEVTTPIEIPITFNNKVTVTYANIKKWEVFILDI